MSTDIELPTLLSQRRSSQPDTASFRRLSEISPSAPKVSRSHGEENPFDSSSSKSVNHNGEASFSSRPTSGINDEQSDARTAGGSVSALINEPSALAPNVDPSVPDGGYGWVIVAACSIVTFFTVGGVYSWGVMQAALVRENLAPSSTLSFVGGLATSCISFFAVLNARLVWRLGARRTGILGCLFFSGGQIMSGWSVVNVGGLFVTAGIVTGLGLSLLFMVISVMPAQYFQRRRGLANGIIYSSSGVGGAVLSYMLDTLCIRFGVAWAFRIQGCVTVALMLPAVLLLRERGQARTSGWPQWRLFRDIKFLALFSAGAIGTFPLLVPPFFLPLYSISLGLSSTQAASLLAGYNLASAAGRLGLGQTADVIGPINTLLISSILTALSMLAIWPFSTTLAPLIVFVITNGIANGGFFSLIPTVVGTVFGPHQMGTAMALTISGWAGGYLMGAPIAGYLLNAYGGNSAGLSAYRPAMYYAGSLALASTAAVYALRSRVATDWRERV